MLAPPESRAHECLDGEGTLHIPIPPEAAFWRVRRHTAGRPRVVVGTDRQPLRLPLDYTPEELLYLVGRGSYRLDLCDETGEQLETIAISIGEPEPELRNQAPSVDEPTTPMLPTTGNEVRLVLEANVRATQLAFQHNERTLAASLRMAETLRDGVHVLAESQADWIKSVASSRGFLRNAAPQLAPPPAETTERDDNEEDDEEPTKDDRLIEFGVAAMTLINNLMESFRGKGRENQPSQGLDLRALLDWRRAAPPVSGTEEEPKPLAPRNSVPDTMRALAALPPEFMTKLRAVREQLSPEEQAQLMPYVMALSPDDLPAVAAELMPKSVDEIAAIFRAEIAKLPTEQP